MVSDTLSFCDILSLFVLGSGEIRLKDYEQYKPKVSLDAVVESVNYKANSRKAYRRRMVDQTAEASDITRAAEEATSLYVKEMPKFNKRNAKV